MPFFSVSGPKRQLGDRGILGPREHVRVDVRCDPNAGMAEEIRLIRDATAQPNRDWATSAGPNKNPNAVTIRPPPYPPKKRR